MAAVEEKEQGSQPPQAAGEGHARAEGQRGGQKGTQDHAGQQPQRRTPGQRQRPPPQDGVEEQQGQHRPGQQRGKIIVPAEEQQHGRQQEEERGVDPDLWQLRQALAPRLPPAAHQAAPPSARSSSSSVSAEPAGLTGAVQQNDEAGVFPVLGVGDQVVAADEGGSGLEAQHPGVRPCQAVQIPKGEAVDLHLSLGGVVYVFRVVRHQPAGQRGQVSGCHIVVRRVQPGGVDKVGVFQTQFLSLLVHLRHKGGLVPRRQPDQGLDTVTAAAENGPGQELFHRDGLARPQAVFGPPGLGHLRGDGEGVGKGQPPGVHLVQDQIDGEHFGQAGGGAGRVRLPLRQEIALPVQDHHAGGGEGLRQGHPGLPGPEDCQTGHSQTGPARRIRPATAGGAFRGGLGACR